MEVDVFSLAMIEPGSFLKRWKNAKADRFCRVHFWIGPGFPFECISLYVYTIFYRYRMCLFDRADRSVDRPERCGGRESGGVQTRQVRSVPLARVGLLSFPRCFPPFVRVFEALAVRIVRSLCIDVARRAQVRSSERGGNQDPWLPLRGGGSVCVRRCCRSTARVSSVRPPLGEYGFEAGRRAHFT